MSCSNLLKTFTFRNAVAEVWDHEGSYNVFLYPKRGIECPEPQDYSKGLMFGVIAQAGDYETDIEDIAHVLKRAKRWIKARVRKGNVEMYKWMITNEQGEDAAWARRQLASLNRKSA